eukprot:157564-Rhodomonas_salina.7
MLLRNHILLRTPFALSGTDLVYAATGAVAPQCEVSRASSHRSPVIALCATRCLVLTSRITLPAATELWQSVDQVPITLRASYSMSSTDLAYGAMPDEEYAPRVSCYAIASTDLQAVSSSDLRCEKLTESKVLRAVRY